MSDNEWAPLLQAASVLGAVQSPDQFLQLALSSLGVGLHDDLEPIAVPSTVLGQPVQRGDLMLRSVPSSDRVHSAVVLSEAATAQSLRARGVPVESGGAGSYVEVLEVPFSGGAPRVVGRRLTDGWGRIPRGESILRPTPAVARWQEAALPEFAEQTVDQIDWRRMRQTDARPTVEQFLESLASGTSATWVPAARVANDFLFSEEWDTADATRNVLLFPDTPQAPRTDVLAAVRGGLVTDSSLRPRVSVIVGAGATPLGIAERIHPVFTAGASAANPAPTAEELAQAILVYSQYYIPVPAMRGYADGLRIPLPVEIEQPGGNWIVNGNTVRLWARGFDAAWRPLLDRRPARLDQPDAAALAAEVGQFLRDQPTALARGIHLLARVLTNPYREVFFFFEAMRQLGRDALDVALNLLDNAVNHQVRLLAALTAGHAILRRLERILRAAVLAPPPGFTPAQEASRTRGSTLLAAALRPGGLWVTRRELPETAQQLAPDAHPPAHRHRMVLGRDVSVGTIGNFVGGDGSTFTGAAIVGGLPPRAFIAASGNLLNPAADPMVAARLRIVSAIAVNEGNLDAVRMRDRGILSLGMQQWSAHADLELPALLAHFQVVDADEFDLFFGIYDLAVRDDGLDAHGNPRFMLQRVQPDGTTVDLGPWNARRDFFGGATAGNTTTFRTEWAARAREAPLASPLFRATEILESTGRFDRIVREVGSLTVGGHPVALTTIIRSELGAALILDAHINMPANVRADLQAAVNAAGNLPDDDAFDRAVTQQYQNIRHTHNTPARNAGIAAQGLNPAHGSFAGW